MRITHLKRILFPITVILLLTTPLILAPLPTPAHASPTNTTVRLLLSLNFTIAPLFPPSTGVEAQVSLSRLITAYNGLVFVPSQEGIMVPVKPLIVALPPGASNISLECSVVGSTVLEGLDVLPVPRGISNLNNYNDINNTNNQTITYPFPNKECAQLARIDHAGSLLLAVIYTYPVVYVSPGLAVAKSLEVKIEAYGENTTRENQTIPTWTRLVVNNPGLLASLASTTDPGYYIITANNSLIPSLYPLLRLRTAMGYHTGIITIPQGSTPDYIRELITNLTYNGVEYVLLVGDNDTLPTANFYAQENFTAYYEGPYKATDLYYALLNGTWDPNGNGRLLEVLDTNGDNYPDYFVEPLPDIAADVMVGRLPFDNSIGVSQAVSHIVNRETGLVTPATDMVMAAAILNYYNESGTGWPRTDAATVAQEILSLDIPNTTRVSSYLRLYEAGGLSPTVYTYDEPLTIDNMYQALYNGARYVLAAGHGNQIGQYRKVWISDLNGDGVPESNELAWPPFQYAPNLTTIGYPSIMYTDACLTGYFDFYIPSLAETLLAKGMGAVIASSRISYYQLGWSDPATGLYDQELDYLFWHVLLNASTSTVGEAVYASKYLYASTRQNIIFQGEDNTGEVYAGFKDFLIYNLLGDPAEPVYIDYSSPLTVNYTLQQILNGEVVRVNVTRNGIPVEGARVSVLTNDARIVASAFTDVNGTVVVSYSSVPGYVGSYYLYVYSSPSPVYSVVLPAPTVSIQPYTIGNVTVPTGVSVSYFRASITGPSYAWVGDNVTVLVSFVYNGSLVLPTNYEVEVYPASAFRSYQVLSTAAGSFLMVNVSSNVSGPVVVDALGVENGYTASAVYSVYFSDEPGGVARDIEETIISYINNNTNTILSSLTNYYTQLSTNLSGILLQINETNALILSKTGVIIENLTRLNATLTSIENKIALLNTSLGEIGVTLSQLNATLTGVEDGMLVLNTSLGEIAARLDALNASLTRVTNGLAVINTSLGELIVAVNNSAESIVSTLLAGQSRIADKLVLVNETLQDISSGIAKINDNMLVLETSLGNITLRLNGLNATLRSVENGIAIVETRIGYLAIPLNESLKRLMELNESLDSAIKNINQNINQFSNIINNKIILVQSSLQELKPIITTVENNTIEINTLIGNIKLNLQELPKLATSINSVKNQLENQTILLSQLRNGHETILAKLNQLQASLNNTMKQLQTSSGEIENIQDQAKRAQNIGIAAAGISTVSLTGVALSFFRRP